MSFSLENATCPSCGRSLSPGTTYCPSCGAAVSYGTNDPTIPSKYPYPPTNYGGVKNPYETEAPIPPPPPPPKRRRVWLWLVPVVLVVLIAVYGGIKGLVSQTNVTSITPQVTSVTATSTAMSERNPYFPYHGTLVLNDPLRNQSKGWDEHPVDTIGAACQLAQDGYHVSEQQIYIIGCFNTMQFSNFTFEVRMKVVKGDCGGIVFDHTDSSDYHFEACQDGTYSFVRYDSSVPTTLLSGQSAPITQGLNQDNLIAVVAIGNKIDLYVNRQTIGSVSDSKYQQGIIGLLAHYYNSPVEIVYSDVKAWTL